MSITDKIRSILGLSAVKTPVSIPDDPITDPIVIADIQAALAGSAPLLVSLDQQSAIDEYNQLRSSDPLFLPIDAQRLFNDRMTDFVRNALIPARATATSQKESQLAKQDAAEKAKYDAALAQIELQSTQAKQKALDDALSGVL